MLEWINNKRKYIIGVLIIAGSVFLLLTKYDITQVPDFIWLILNGLGFSVVRIGINAVSENDNKGWITHLAAAGIAVLGVLRMAGIEFPPEVLVAFEGLGVVGLQNATGKIE